MLLSIKLIKKKMKEAIKTQMEVSLESQIVSPLFH